MIVLHRKTSILETGITSYIFKSDNGVKLKVSLDSGNNVTETNMGKTMLNYILYKIGV